MEVTSITIKSKDGTLQTFTVDEKWEEHKITKIFIEASADDEDLDISVGIYGCKEIPTAPELNVEYWADPDLIKILWLTGNWEEEGYQEWIEKEAVDEQ